MNTLRFLSASLNAYKKNISICYFNRSLQLMNVAVNSISRYMVHCLSTIMSPHSHGNCLPN